MVTSKYKDKLMKTFKISVMALMVTSFLAGGISAGGNKACKKAAKKITLEINENIELRTKALELSKSVIDESLPVVLTCPGKALKLAYELREKLNHD